MKINCIKLKNFRKFETATLNFSDQFNILIGDNGAGKTAILDAVAISLGPLLSGFGVKKRKEFAESDIRKVQIEFGDQVTSERQYPSSIKVDGIFNGEEYLCELGVLSRGKKIKYQLPNPASKTIKSMVQRVQSGEDVMLPLIAQYGTDRLWKTSQLNSELSKPASRLDSYDLTANSTSTSKALVSWFKTNELAGLQRNGNATLDAVKNAVAQCIPEWKDVYFDVRQDELVASTQAGLQLPFRLLSDGVRNMIALVADIARMTVALNPHLGGSAISKTSGIVLIDEIGLHLHPTWQRRVVDDFRRTFPALQFLVTTHSPFIVQAGRGNELINLDIDAAAYEEWQSIEDISEDVMGVENVERSRRFQEMKQTASEYFKVLDKAADSPPEERSKLEEELNKLIETYVDDPAYSAYLQIKREVRLKAGKQSENNEMQED